MLLVIAPAAHAAGTFTGKVTRDNGGAEISGACVRAVNLNGDSSVIPNVVETTTDANGDYTLNVNPNGRWGVQFYTCPNVPGQSFVAEWWQDSRSAFGQQLTIADGSTQTLNASLADGGSIAGVVTDPDGEPVEDVCVFARNTDGTDEYLPPAKTNAQGEYRIGGLVGNYLVAFDVGYEGCAPDELLLYEYYEDTRDPEQAQVLGMNDAIHLFGDNGIDAQLDAPASLTGVVTDHTGAAIEDACVSIQGSGDNFGSAKTGPDGRYTIQRVIPGDYKISFDPCGQSDDLPEYWQNKRDEESADVVTLVAGDQPTEYSAQLQEPPSLSGTVTDPDGDPLAGICVDLFDAAAEDQLANTTTDVDGEYLFDADDFDDLEGTQVLVNFYPCSGPTLLLGEWYDSQPDMESATPIDISGGPVTDINAQLAEGPGISGAVEDPDGNPISGICVFLVVPGAGSQYFDTTDSNGEYVAGPLVPGRYLVHFVPCNGGGWLPEYFDDSPNANGAAEIVVTAEAGAEANAVLEPGGTIAGTVSGPNGPVENVCVTLRKAGSGARVELGNTVRTDSSGAYAVDGLASGNYTVKFAACYVQDDGTQNLQPEYYDDADTVEESEPVSVAAGETTDEVDATLAEGTRISGRVTGADSGEPVDGICVSASALDGSIGSDDVTNANGEYSIPALTPGDYTIRFGACGANGYLPEYWEDAYTQGASTPYTASPGNNTADAVLERGGSISGRVTGPGGEAAPGVCVDLFDADSGEYLQGEEETNGNGEYTVSGVPAGEVKVRFSSCGGGSYVAEYYDDARRLRTATAVTVSAQQTTANVNASLAQAGSISGTVTGPGGDSLDYICVTALTAGEESFAGRSARTDDDGRYEIGGLDAGEYKLRFSDCGGHGVATEWWDDKPSREAADPIVVTAGQQITGKNAQLAEQGDGAIQGAVSESDGGDSSDACVTVYDAQSGEVVNGGNVQGGTYRISGLPAGDYKVGFQSCGANLAMEFYGGPASDGVRTLDEAAVLHLDAGETISGIDAELGVGSRIRGQVTDPDGDGVAYTCVEVYDESDPEFRLASTETRQDGSFTVDGLAPGDYKVKFNPECFGGSSRLAAEYWDDQSSFGAATVIVVGAAGTTVSAINAELEAKAATPTVTSGPSGQTADRRPAFGFTPPADADLECSIDTGTPQWGPCSGPNSHAPGADLADGTYTFRVRATTDWDQAVATRAFTVAGTVVDPPGDPDPDPPADPDPNPPADPPKDTTAPVLEITKAPKAKTTDRTPTFAFAADDPGAVFACAVDGEKAKACSSPTTLKKLRRGKHTFAVVAADPAGNFSKPVSVKFKVKKRKRR